MRISCSRPVTGRFCRRAPVPSCPDSISPARIYRPARRRESPGCFRREWLMPGRSRRKGAPALPAMFRSTRAEFPSVHQPEAWPAARRYCSVPDAVLAWSTRPAATSRCEFCYRRNGRSPASKPFQRRDRYGEKNH
ncbi:hypothetical protein LFZ89_17785 [Salmonella enterica subsp. enterica serovar Gallinarum]|nr:hypothetical protein LFZ89_17785 [Salmonella enterica subsp. enterica serovar Gallinarum]KSB48809.1 hypothetical protein LFZ39_23790 [Salmonella enterica subsp. enterica serovar Pullorum]